MFGSSSGFGGTPTFGTGGGFGTGSTPSFGTGGGFGASSTPSFGTSTPSFGGFGAATSTTTTTFGSTGFSFGAPASSTTTSSFSFGNTGTSTPSFGGGFGGSSFGGGFGAPTTTSFGTGNSTFGTGFSFGGATTTTTATSFNSNTFGMMGGAPSTFISRETPFNQLDPEKQAKFKEIEKRIREQGRLRDDLKGATKRSATLDTSQPMQVLASLASDIKAALTSISSLSAEVNAGLKHTHGVMRTLDQHNPSRHNETIFLPSHYHWGLLASFEERMVETQQHIEELGRYWQGVEHQVDSPQSCRDILRNQNEVLVALASRVAQLHDFAQELKAKYIAFKQRKGEDVSGLFIPPKKPVDPLEDDTSETVIHAQQFQQQQQQQPPPYGPSGVIPQPTTSLGSSFGGFGGFSTTPSSTFGAASTPFGSTSTFGTTSGFGSSGFGTPTSGFGSGFGTPTSSFGGGFGTPTSGFGGSGFGGGGFGNGTTATKNSNKKGSKKGR